MRTYLVSRGDGQLVLTCKCGVEKPLIEFVEPVAIRPKQIGSINTHLLAQWMARFNYDHSACPSQPPDPKP